MPRLLTSSKILASSFKTFGNTFSKPCFPEASTDAVRASPPVVRELVMNGFELPRVLHAYDLVGDNFDDLLAFLVTQGTAQGV